MAPTTTAISAGHFRRLLIVLAAIGLAIALIAVQTPGASLAKGGEGGGSQAAKIVHIAKSHLGARFRMGSEGMRTFDCSGLVYRVYQQAGLLGKIGGKRMLAAQYYRWFKARGLASRGNPQPGDLAWWTHKGRITHMGMYIGGGRFISALINPWGVKVHHQNTIRARFLAFGHVRLGS